MATRAESATVYAAGAVQGIVLVTFPAASTIFTDPTTDGLSAIVAVAMGFVSFGVTRAHEPSLQESGELS